MKIIEWSIWGLACIAFVLFAVDVFDERMIVRIATRMITVILLPALIVTAFTSVSKFHLLWFVPVVFYICRAIAGAIFFNRVTKRINKEVLNKKFKQ